MASELCVEMWAEVEEMVLGEEDYGAKEVEGWGRVVVVVRE